MSANISRRVALAALERADAELDGRLREAQRLVEEATAALEDARGVRAGVIGEAIGEGWTLTKVGGSLGVSKQRVAQLRAAEVEAGADG